MAGCSPTSQVRPSCSSTSTASRRSISGGLAGLAAPLFVCVASFGSVLPNATALAMAPHGANAGVASALLGTIQFGVGALAAMAVGALHDGTALPMAGVIAASGAGALAVNLALTRPPRG